MADVIKLEDVSKKLGQREILEKVSLSVAKGDIFGYLGPNGAGKTTTIRIILGLMQPTSGRVSVMGQDVQVDRVRQKIGFVMESDGLYDNMSAYANLLYYASLYDIDLPRAKIEAAISMVGLADRAQDKVGTYSKGMRQRLALARAVVHDPEVLVLDEPTAGVDPTGQIEIRQIMLDMVNNKGKTILLSSHNLDEVQRICSRIALIDRGRIRLYGELEKLQHEMSSGGLIIETREPLSAAVLAELAALPDVKLGAQKNTVLNLSLGKNVDVSAIVNLLSARGARIEQVKKQEASLEEIYTAILKESGDKRE
jgi:ABC-2 type transport system ATP-binding protein